MLRMNDYVYKRSETECIKWTKTFSNVEILNVLKNVIVHETFKTWM